MLQPLDLLQVGRFEIMFYSYGSQLASQLEGDHFKGRVVVKHLSRRPTDSFTGGRPDKNPRVESRPLT